MQDHEFYADPTVFDYWQGRASDWLCRRSRKLCPYGWTLAFAFMAALFALTAVAVFFWALTGRMDGGAQVAWNQSMAQVITIMMALLACRAMLRQALYSWPAGNPMNRRLRRLVRRCGWEIPAAASALKTHSRPRSPGRHAAERNARDASGGKDIQTFFSGVRAAGVNVTIARALFSAGIRTPQQLCRASDKRLLAIRGVGAATVCKLRRHFDYA